VLDKQRAIIATKINTQLMHHPVVAKPVALALPVHTHRQHLRGSICALLARPVSQVSLVKIVTGLRHRPHFRDI
jgi:hypothetical protein